MIGYRIYCTLIALALCTCACLGIFTVVYGIRTINHIVIESSPHHPSLLSSSAVTPPGKCRRIPSNTSSTVSHPSQSTSQLTPQQSSAQHANRHDPYPYVIRWGDTLSELAEQYHTHVSTLARMNHVVNPDHIYAGDTLIIPR